MDRNNNIERRKILFFFLLLLTSCNKTTLLPHSLVADTCRIKNDLNQIVHTVNYRNYQHTESLNQAAAYIKSEFSKVSDSVKEQPYDLTVGTFKNIICSLGTKNKERIIVGAHYDVCGAQDGADDNASGVAGILELARLLSKEDLKYRIDLVAYTLEEPPIFKTECMGSYIHAKYLNDHKIPVKGMISLEMIGYYDDKPKSQHYPLGFLKWFYGNKGNYITIVQKWGNGKFGNTFKELMKQNQYIPTKSFTGPKFLPGVDYSDHLNYWKFGYSAVMVTNTSFYRNNNYHRNTDKIETLDMKRMALLIDEICVALKKIP